MDEKTPLTSKNKISDDGANADSKRCVFRWFCALHAILLGGCAGALLMGVRLFLSSSSLAI